MRKGTQGSPFFEPQPSNNSGRRGHDPSCLGDFIAANATGAHLDPSGCTIDLDLYGLEVGIPAPAGPVVRMTDVIPRRRSLATHRADPRHKSILPESAAAAEYLVAFKHNDLRIMTQPMELARA